MTATVEITYSTVTARVPKMVARGNVRLTSLISSAGTVADSSPRNAHSVNVAANEIAWKWPTRLPWPGSKGEKLAVLM